MSDFKYLKECDCGCENVKSDNVVYFGPTLPCTGIVINDTLTRALQKIDKAICDINAINCYYWEGTINQSGTNAPVVNVTDTNFPPGYTVTPLYMAVGQYFLTFTGLPNFFHPQHTIILAGHTPFNYSKLYVQVVAVNTTSLYIETRDVLSNTLLNELLQNTSIYIKNCLTLPSTTTTTTTI